MEHVIAVAGEIEMVLMVAQEEEHLFIAEHQVTEQPDKVIEGLILLVEEIEVGEEAEQEE